MASPLACALCGDRIGVYEPFYVLSGDGSVTVTSLASQASGRSPGEICIHRSCSLDPTAITDRHTSTENRHRPFSRRS